MNGVKAQVDDSRKLNLSGKSFRLGTSLAENVRAFRFLIGSETGDPVSYDKVAEWLLQAGHADPPSGSTVRRWIERGTEPDFRSVWLMSRRAGVTMEEFCGFDVPQNSTADSSSRQDEAAPSVGPDAAADVNQPERMVEVEEGIDVPHPSTRSGAGSEGKKRRPA